jgi:nicotinamide-nucleotide amidase
MAEGIRRRTGATIGIGVTGIAGPGGATPDKPVGTVALAAASAGGTVVRTLRFSGNRAQIKHFTTQAALDMIRRIVLGETAAPPG